MYLAVLSHFVSQVAFLDKSTIYNNLNKNNHVRTFFFLISQNVFIHIACNIHF